MVTRYKRKRPRCSMCRAYILGAIKDKRISTIDGGAVICIKCDAKVKRPKSRPAPKVDRDARKYNPETTLYQDQIFCEYCHKRVDTSDKTKKYCSVSHRQMATKKRRLLKEAEGKYIRPTRDELLKEPNQSFIRTSQCPNCHEVFHTLQKVKIYCSMTCKNEAKERRRDRSGRVRVPTTTKLKRGTPGYNHDL